MKVSLTVLCTGIFCCALAAADDRLTLGANGSTLTDTDGGGGGSLGYLHELKPGNLIGIGAEYQTIADARWAFGTLRGAWSGGQPTNLRWSVYGDFNYGSGEIGQRSFDHVTESLGIGLTFPSGWTVQLEDRQIDIDTTHGNLPKLALAYLWKSRWLTTVSYAESVSGNLGTELVSGRVDYYSSGRSRINLFVGAAGGQASPAVFNLQTGLVQPGRNMKAVYVGLTKPFARTDITLVGDYLSLSGDPKDMERFTLTLNCSFYLRPRAQPK